MSNFIVNTDIPNLRVVIREGDQYNINVVPGRITTARTGSFNTYADLAGQVVTASYALTAETLLGSIESASYAFTASYVLGTTSNWDGITGKPVGLVSSSTQVNYNQIQNQPTTIPTASKILGGTQNYIPLWQNTNTLSSSRIFQTQSSVLIGATTQHTPEAPDTLGIFAEAGNTSYNLMSGHGDVDNYLQVNIKNFSAGPSASTDFVATADTGTETSGYVDLGINSSGYTNTGAGVGVALDAYLYVQDAGDLLIGNKSAQKRIVIFSGEGNAIDNARILADPSGSIGINTGIFDVDNPETLLIQSISDTSFNLIKGISNLNNYIQFNIQNIGTGDTASSDIVATANNGTETTNFIDMGINGSNYAILNAVGGPNDAYLYSTGNHLHIGNATPGHDIMFFVGSTDAMASNKLTLRDDNKHNLTGSLETTEGVTGSLFGTSSWATYAITASYVSGAASTWDTLTNKPSGLLSSSTQVDFTQIQNQPTTIPTASYVLNAVSASFATTASYVLGAVSTWNDITEKPIGLVSSSVQINTGSFTGSFTGQFIGTSSWANNAISSSISTTASFAISSSRTVTASFAITSSYATNTELLDGLNSTVFATTGSNVFNGNQTITGSLFTNADTLIFTGSFFTSGSVRITGSLGVSAGITGSLFGSSSFATTASAATSITFIPITSSYSLTSSYIDGGLY